MVTKKALKALKAKFPDYVAKFTFIDNTALKTGDQNKDLAKLLSESVDLVFAKAGSGASTVIDLRWDITYNSSPGREFIDCAMYGYVLVPRYKPAD